MHLLVKLILLFKRRSVKQLAECARALLTFLCGRRDRHKIFRSIKYDKES